MTELLGTNPALSLYIHFPYCERKCPYCDFNSHEHPDIPEQDYVRAILWRLRHLRHTPPMQNDTRPIHSVFFGGGTPSLLSPHAVETILEHTQQHFPLAPDCEITLEANPSSAEQQKFSAWKQAGVNRISIGVQSFDDHALRFLGRLHDARQARAALEAAARTFPRFSLDLITALPQQCDQAVRRELAIAARFGAEHLCVYQLTIEKATAFYRAQARGALTLPSHARAAHLYRLVEQELAELGYAPYEISSYAKNSEAQSRHNLVYWNSGDWLGIGPGAHGRITHSAPRNATPTTTRAATLETRDPNRWLKQAQAQDARIEKRILLSPQEAREERVMMGLRLVEGVPLNLFDKAAQLRIVDLCKEGYCEKTALRLHLTREGRLRLDTIVACLLDEPYNTEDCNIASRKLGVGRKISNKPSQDFPQKQSARTIRRP